MRKMRFEAERKWKVSRLFFRRKNRRIRPKTSTQAAPLTKPRPALRTTFSRVLKKTAKVGLLIALLAALGGGGFHVYRRVMAANYFAVARLEIEGLKRANPEELKRLVASIKGRHILSIDLKMLKHSMLSHPWVKRVEVNRELPRTVRFKIEEHHPQALLLMGHLYLVSNQGRVFKRADLHEQAGLPVITGIERLTYINKPELAGSLIKRALTVLDQVQQQQHPPLSEIHITPSGELTLYLVKGGTTVRLGTTFKAEEFKKLEQVLTALGPETERARVFYLDNEAHPERVTVRMATAQ